LSTCKGASLLRSENEMSPEEDISILPN